MYDLKKIIELKELNEKIIGSNNISTKWLNLVRKLEYTRKKRKFVTKPRVKMGTCEKIQIWIYVSLET